MISVCLASYNGEKFIETQIRSILKQLSTEDELIISDDNSSDSTLSIINSINDSRIKLIKHAKPEKIDTMYKSFLFATKNFENALNYAKGDFIFLSDQDDIWLEGKVKSCIEKLQEYDCIVHNYQKIDKNGNLIQERAFSRNPLHQTLFLNVLDNHFRGCCMAFKANYLKYILPIPEKVIGHDYWIGSLLAKIGRVYYDVTPYIQSRWYPESVSAKKKTSLLYKIKFRVNLYIELKKMLRKLS